MDNEELVNEYIAQLTKSVNDLTVENILLRSKQAQSGKTAGNLVEQVHRQIEEIKELKEAQQNLPTVDEAQQSQEFIDLKAKSDEAEDYILRLEEGLEKANEIIAKFEQEKDAAIAKCAELEKQLKSDSRNGKKVKEITTESEEYKTLYKQNVALLKTVDFNEKKITELKEKLHAYIRDAAEVTQDLGAYK
jgi:DNA repair exonuclease SbcCD ATPase subunit